MLGIEGTETVAWVEPARDGRGLASRGPRGTLEVVFQAVTAPPDVSCCFCLGDGARRVPGASLPSLESAPGPDRRHFFGFFAPVAATLPDDWPIDGEACTSLLLMEVACDSSCLSPMGFVFPRFIWQHRPVASLTWFR